jgi:beta-glucosidase
MPLFSWQPVYALIGDAETVFNRQFALLTWPPDDGLRNLAQRLRFGSARLSLRPSRSTVVPLTETEEREFPVKIFFRSFAVISTLSMTVAVSLTAQKYPFQDPTLPMEKRVDNLLSLMTIDEKIDSFADAGVVAPRLGVKGTNIGEALSGVVYGSPLQKMFERKASPAPESKSLVTPTTQFPEGVGLARTWDPDLVKRAGDVVGSEARYIYESGKAKAFLVLLTPNADLARDPRWGRTAESYGEDPYLSGTMAVAFIQGIQGNDPNHLQASSLVKHFLANSTENNRNNSSANFDERLLYEYYSVPFRMAFVDGGAKNFMTASNALNHVPMTVSPLLKELAVKEWSTDGIICTDAGSLGNMVTQYKAFPNLKASAAASIKAGVNMPLTTFEKYKTSIRGALDDRLLTESDLDTALRGSVRTAIQLGLIDPPEQNRFAALKGGPDPVVSREHKAIAKQVALESIVLLKNSSNFLPLDRHQVKSIAVIGNLANEELPDLYGGTPPYAITPLAGITAKAGEDVSVTYAADNKNGAAEKAASTSDVAVVIVGNRPTCGRTPLQIIHSFMASAPCTNPSEGMESSDRQSLELEQENLVKTVFQANPRTVVVLVSGFPYAINWTQSNVPAILHMSHNSQEEGSAIADVLFGDYNPSGRLVQTWVKSASELPPMEDYDIRHGRTYMYAKGEPLYPFGYGLSYSTFKYSNLKMSASKMHRDGEIMISVDVQNISARAGDEVVQLYLRHNGSKVERPLKELKGFARVSLQPNETKTVQLRLKAADLAFWDVRAQKFLVEDESVSLTVGGSSADAKMTAKIKIGS